MMNKAATYFASMVGMVLLVQPIRAADVQVQLHCNKQEYISCEPVLFETTVSSKSGKDFHVKRWWSGQGYSGGFRIYMAFGGEQFFDIQGAKGGWKSQALGINPPPTGYRAFYDWHHLPGSLKAGEVVKRLDMLIVPKPGNYALKTVLEEDGTKYESNPVQFRVIELGAKPDSISKLGGQDFLRKLSATIFSAHYLRDFFGDAMLPVQFAKVGRVIIEEEEHKDSVFREYVLYADLMASHVRERRWQLSERGKQLAGRFIKDYPKSWLLPDVYRMLFFSYFEEKDEEKANAVRKKLLQLAPNYAMVKRLCKPKPRI